MADDSNALLEAALEYAGRGWPVFPLHSLRADGSCTCRRDDCDRAAKHPRTRNGLHDATTDPEAIRAWWRRWPDANVGLRTGVAFDVLDCDDTTHEAYWTWAADAGWDGDAPMVRTGSGGLHVYFNPTGLGNRAGWRPSLDWRGEGGYVVAPPSLHASGEQYLWL